jgi:branched-chain amino acid transport system substrate-binding protein
MLRRHLSAALAGLLLTAGIARAQEPVQLGSIEILSGPNAAYGTAIKAGLELALAEVNTTGVLGGRKINLIVEDSAANKDQAINAARKLIGRDKVVAIIGPTLSNEMFAVGPVAQERHIPILGTSTTANGITAIGDYVFRTSLPESDVIPVTLKKAQSRGVKTIALMYANDDAFSKSGFDVMKAAAEKVGLKIVDIESFGSKDSDFSAQLTKIKDLTPDAIGISALVEPRASCSQPGSSASGRRRCSSAAMAATHPNWERSPARRRTACSSEARGSWARTRRPTTSSWPISARRTAMIRTNLRRRPTTR